MMQTLSIQSRQRMEMIPITREVADALQRANLRSGAVLVYTPHTTAGVTINENADPDVLRDVQMALEKHLPDLPGYRHAEGNSDAHVRSSVIGCSAMIPVENGVMMLGTWQGIVFCEFDGPRRRQVYVQFLGAACHQ